MDQTKTLIHNFIIEYLFSSSLLKHKLITTRSFQFTDEIFYRWLDTKSVGTTFTDRLIDKNTSSKNLSSMIYGLLLSSSVIKLLMDLQTCQTKKNLPILIC